jgi:SH3-like domain-containing protein
VVPSNTAALSTEKPATPKIQPAATPKPATAVASVDPTDDAPLDAPPEAEVDVEGKQMWVGGTALNMRAGPSASTAKLSVLPPGATVSVLETADNWAFVTDGSGESGWVYSRYLSGQPGGEAPADRPTAAVASTSEDPKREPRRLVGRINGEIVLRAGPSRSAPTLFALRPGERITLVEKRGRWVRVVMESGVSAWVDARDLSR